MSLRTTQPAMSDALHADRVKFRAFLAHRIGDPTGMADLLRKNLPQALRQATGDSGETNLTTWFRHVLRRAVVDYVRTREPAAAREAAWRTASSASSEADDLAISRCLASLLPTLKPRHAALLHLVELDGASVPAAAAALDLPAKTATATLRRARCELRAQLEKFCDTCARSACLD